MIFALFTIHLLSFSPLSVIIHFTHWPNPIQSIIHVSGAGQKTIAQQSIATYYLKHNKFNSTTATMTTTTTLHDQFHCIKATHLVVYVEQHFWVHEAHKSCDTMQQQQRQTGKRLELPVALFSLDLISDTKIKTFAICRWFYLEDLFMDIHCNSVLYSYTWIGLAVDNRFIKNFFNAWHAFHEYFRDNFRKTTFKEVFGLITIDIWYVMLQVTVGKQDYKSYMIISSREIGQQ